MDGLTSTSGHSHGSFSSTGQQVLSSLIHFIGVSILAHYVSRRLSSEDCSSFWAFWAQLTWPRFCVLVVFIDSWLFLFASGILIFGVGLESSRGVCSAAIYLCIMCYATSKFFIYLFLIEKVHIVWTPLSNTKRFKSPLYVICFSSACVYVVVVLLMVFGRIYYFREDGVCVIGLKHISSYPLLIFDLYINIFLTGLFIWPLARLRYLNPGLRKVASRTLIAAATALTSSTANVAILGVLHGTELGWICLGSCGADVILNASALFWVSRGAVVYRTQPDVSTCVPPPSERGGPPVGPNVKLGPLTKDRPISEFDSVRPDRRDERKNSIGHRVTFPSAVYPETVTIEASVTPATSSSPRASLRNPPSLFGSVSYLFSRGLTDEWGRSNSQIPSTVEHEMEGRNEPSNDPASSEDSHKNAEEIV